MKFKITCALLTLSMVCVSYANENHYAKAIKHENIKDHEEAVRLYQLAADQGSSDAKFSLGRIFRDIYDDKDKSFDWFLSSAKQGNSFAAYEVAMLYRSGSSSTQPDQDKAIYWLKKAAEKRNKDAVYGLFQVIISIEEKGTWLIKAAELGHIEAMRSLSEAYQTGSYGIPIDNLLSAEWLDRATDAAE